MSLSEYRSMRIILFFDLPSKTDNDKKKYREFRRFLMYDGYIMVQYSVYSRFCRNHYAVRKHINRIEKIKPKNGEIRIMTVTEKQYLSTYVINGDFNYHEKILSKNPIVEV